METLVLSAAYEPVARVNWQRAITLWYLGKVEIIEEYDNEVSSVTFSMNVPAVVRFYRALRGRRRAIKFSRENVLMRDKSKCQYCNNKVSRTEFTYDHVIPKSRGGKTTWTNIVTSCVPCNSRKGSRLPEEARMYPVIDPVRPKSLPLAVNLSFIYRDGMPKTWKQYLYDISYWHGALEDEGK